MSEKGWDKTTITDQILFSKAWLSLGGKAPQVYMLFRYRVQTEKVKYGPDKGKHREKNTQELTFTYKQAVECGLTQNTFLAALDALIAKGFLDVVSYGGGLEHRKTVYGLSDRWRKFGEQEFVAVDRVSTRGAIVQNAHERMAIL